MWAYILVLFGYPYARRRDVNVSPTDIPLSVPLECMSVVHFKRFELIRRLSTVPFQHFAGSR